MRVKHSVGKIAFPFVFFISALFIIFSQGCSDSGNKEKGSPEYIASIRNWHNKRVENLKKENGWLNLAGLFWLKDGKNKIGSAGDNDIIFPNNVSPAHIGVILLLNGSAKFTTAPNVEVTNNGKSVKTIDLVSDTSDNPTVLATGPLRWFIVRRGDKTGIRLRNLDSPLLKSFKGIGTFPINEKWKINARFVPYNPPKIITIPSIIGTTETDTVSGYLSFKINNVNYKLDPVEEDKQLFIIFADETNGEETYGAGRFLYTDGPDSSGKVVLDFNKAYNPPCAFTPYATCPLPPKQNYLHLKITAGEKKYGTEHD